MGKLIEVDKVKKKFPIMENDFGMVVNETLHKELDKITPVEAIPKTEYENRLKADMVAMLTEIKNKFIDKSWNIDMYDDDLDFECCYLTDIDEIIQQKINALKSESEEE